MTKEMSVLHEQVLRLIPGGGRGGRRSITFKEIMQTLGLGKSHERDVRQVLVDLVMKYGYPIGSSADSDRKGFFIIETVDELERASHTLTSRRRHIDSRNKTMIENFKNHHQLSLEESAEVERLI